MPKYSYKIEATYMGPEPPWEGWKVIRVYTSSNARDKDLERLNKNEGTKWLYRKA